MLKRVGIIRKIDDNGRVVIPKHLRDLLNISGGVEWFVDLEKKEIIIRPVKKKEGSNLWQNLK